VPNLNTTNKLQRM